jgi:glycine/D-amino acid oxidase-like deaminating enzyme
MRKAFASAVTGRRGRGAYDVAVVGGGALGAAIAYGLVRRGRKVVMLDEGDLAFRAARGNFGIVWVQGKGVDAPPYARWTRLSSDLWPDYAAELEEATGIALGYARPGGVEICLDEDEWAARASELSRLQDQSEGRFQYEMLDREALADLLPPLGPRVLGGSFSPLDGHVNPLYLLRALHAAFAAKGGHYLPEATVSAIDRDGAGFTLKSAENTVSAGRVVLAAGFGNRDLAPQVGLSARLEPICGQILVTEKLAPFLRLPTALVRQTAEGGCLLGDSHEEVGFDEGTSRAVMGAIARRAVATFPCLGSVRVVRAWGCLRVMTPDGLPVYEVSEAYPGAYQASAHSGITLAAAHSLLLAGWIDGGDPPADLEAFASGRFDG